MGKMEYWNIGTMGQNYYEMMKYWNVGGTAKIFILILGFLGSGISPLFHVSIIPLFQNFLRGI
jgi:hypothetical protein